MMPEPRTRNCSSSSLQPVFSIRWSRNASPRASSTVLNRFIVFVGVEPRTPRTPHGFAVIEGVSADLSGFELVGESAIHRRFLSSLPDVIMKHWRICWKVWVAKREAETGAVFLEAQPELLLKCGRAGLVNRPHAAIPRTARSHLVDPLHNLRSHAVAHTFEDVANCTYRIIDEVGISHVDDPVRKFRVIVAELHEALSTLREDGGFARMNLIETSGTAIQSPQNASQSCGGAQDFNWVSMGLDYRRVGENFQQLFQPENVIGGFQDPLRSRTSRLKILEEAFFPLVSRRNISMAQESFIRWNAARRNKLLREKRVTVNSDTLVWSGSAHRINSIRPRGQHAKTPQAERRFANTLLRVVRNIAPASHREHHFPDAGRAVTWNLGQQFMQVRRAASGHADDENRVFYRVDFAGILRGGAGNGIPQ